MRDSAVEEEKRLAVGPSFAASLRSCRRSLPLSAVLALFFCLSAGWALCIPVPASAGAQRRSFNPDEDSHIKVIEYMAARVGLPPYNAEYEISLHPPLYHALAALVFAVARPRAGRANAVRLLRLFSCAMGVATLSLIYHAVRWLAPRGVALLAAGCAAGVPMFVSLSAAVSNENLATLAATASLYVIVAGLRHGFNGRRIAALSTFIVVGIGSKETCLGLLPAAFVAVWLAGRRRGLDPALIVRQMLVVFGVSLLATGWWFVRNQVVYGDPFRQAATDRIWEQAQPGYAVLAARKHISAAYYAASLTKTGWMSFWGRFDAFNRPLPLPMYVVLACVQAAAGTGAVLLWRQGDLWRHEAAEMGAMAVFAVFVTAVFYRYNWAHWTPQGRYFFPLLLPFALITAAGWRALFTMRRRPVASLGLLLGLLGLNLYAFTAIALPLLPGQ